MNEIALKALIERVDKGMMLVEQVPEPYQPAVQAALPSAGSE